MIKSMSGGMQDRGAEVKERERERCREMRDVDELERKRGKEEEIGGDKERGGERRTREGRQ